MAIIIERSFLNFKKKDIYLSDFPYDIDDKVDIVYFHYCKNRINLPGYICEEKFTSTIDLTQESEEIWKKMNRKLRQKIRKATKEKIIWKINENFEEFYTISKDFVKEKGYSPSIGRVFGYDLPTIKIMEKYGTLFTAELNEEILCGHLYLMDKENILAWISSSKRLSVNHETSVLINYANCLLHWEAINYAKEKSLKTFNWGGISPDPKKNSINSYKLSFGGQIELSYFYIKINNKLYYKFYHLYKYLK